MPTDTPTELTPAVLRGIPLPAPGQDKEDRGRVCVIGGSARVPGAARLAGEAALRAGAGKLQIITARSVACTLAVAVPEAMVVGLRERADGEIAAGDKTLDTALEDCGALVIGPGMLGSRFLERLTTRAAQAKGQIVLDAGALQPGVRAAEGAPFVLTPHAGEMATLCGRDKDAVEEDPLAHARRMAAQTRSVVVMKGPHTHVVAPGGQAWRNDGGGPGLGTSGSGDVLAGLIAGYAARGASALEAALWGVWTHGEAGRRLAIEVGTLGFLAREIALRVPAILQGFPLRGQSQD